ncbi:F-box/kelch-repeat protein At3g61590-like [Macadamia integrifolia]|uniref:F-box/kelch-repeat protein At3g61590-like n=1 Tax=Macadamia integrifolia TaxID=60698 RepID=UPI001C4F6328|nr:F-box/kelch-repeat protein At3g61590-like [Macadamia integrifolia]XP_042503629.1 F-box/kelch-repeat protein At3g61590-like [Macadamia integrifolia]
MEEETSWITDRFDDIGREFTCISKFERFPEISDEGNNLNLVVPIDFILPDDLLERIFVYLPIASIFRAGCVCKRWNELVNSRRLSVLSQKPWYFMFTSSDEPTGYAYDPILRKWYSLELPRIETPNWFIASSCGLVCFMDNDSRSQLFVCNPITKEYKILDEPPGLKYSDYSALAISVDRISHSYTVAIAKSKQVPGNFIQWDLSVDVYESETMTWETSATELLTGWRGGDESVICDGVLYFLIYSTVGGMGWHERHGLIMHDLSSRSSRGKLMQIPVPCPLTCGRLMNLNDKLVMVGGIGKPDRPDIIKGIGIWILNGEEWQEVSRMPHKFFQGFGEFDDVFASSGTDDLIYIQSYGAPALLVFDMNQKQWKWSQKCPVTKRFPLQLFTGFCFEPRLEVAP